MSRYRHEYKYILTPPQEALLKMKAEVLLQRDPHVQKDGGYVVRSVYLDDAAKSCLAENLAGTDPRSKFLIRRYNDDTARLLLENGAPVEAANAGGETALLMAASHGYTDLIRLLLFLLKVFSPYSPDRQRGKTVRPAPCL